MRGLSLGLSLGLSFEKIGLAWSHHASFNPLHKEQFINMIKTISVIEQLNINMKYFIIEYILIIIVNTVHYLK
jgi:hypothetical protein